MYMNNVIQKQGKHMQKSFGEERAKNQSVLCSLVPDVLWLKYCQCDLKQQTINLSEQRGVLHHANEI